MINKFVIKFLPTCLPSGLTVAAPDAFGRIPDVNSMVKSKWGRHRMKPKEPKMKISIILIEKLLCFSYATNRLISIAEIGYMCVWDLWFSSSYIQQVGEILIITNILLLLIRGDGDVRQIQFMHKKGVFAIFMFVFSFHLIISQARTDSINLLFLNYNNSKCHFRKR